MPPIAEGTPIEETPPEPCNKVTTTDNGRTEGTICAMGWETETGEIRAEIESQREAARQAYEADPKLTPTCRNAATPAYAFWLARRQVLPCFDEPVSQPRLESLPRWVTTARGIWRGVKVHVRQSGRPSGRI